MLHLPITKGREVLKALMFSKSRIITTFDDFNLLV